jgi:hypothetical protein
MGLGLNACAEGFRKKTSYETFTMANAQASKLGKAMRWLPLP